ncbi:MAG: cytochrome c [Anaerolineae bacterium]
MHSRRVAVALSSIWCAAVLVIAGCTQASPPLDITLIPAAERTPSRFTDPELAEGETQYNLLCAHCHGYNLEGQLAVTVPQTLNLGMHTVPPHDSTGHTWQHPDQLLIRVIREGIQNPLDQYVMPGFTDGVSDAQVNAILRYIKLSWTEAQREHNRQVTEQWAEMDRLLGNASATEVTPEATDESAQ